MNDPLKIMDEIERNTSPVWGCLLDPKDVQSLRTALERQAEELAQAKANTCLPDDHVMIPLSEWQHMVDTEHELTQAKARIARLEEAAKFVLFVPQNITALNRLDEALNESPARLTFGRMKNNV